MKNEIEMKKNTPSPAQGNNNFLQYNQEKPKIREM